LSAAARAGLKAQPKPLALFGGTFDPVHLGHAAIVQGAFARLGIERLIILPAGNPYQRGHLPLASAAHRVAMLKLAFAHAHGISIDQRELNRIGPTYTVPTLRELRRERGDTLPLIWLIGADAFSRLDTWHRWQELFDLCHFAVVRRAGEMPSAAAFSPALAGMLSTRRADAAALAATPCGHVAELAIEPPPVSSTEIRRRRAAGESLRGLVADAVCDYIEQHKLYLTDGK
jgi:nicotinate-nucleotide adenylyltransferase